MRSFGVRCAAGLLSVAAALSACDTIKGFTDDVIPQGTRYEDSQSLPPLEVPPGLAAATIKEAYEIPEGGAATYSEYADRSATGPSALNRPRPAATVAPDVLPPTPEIRVERSGDTRWLVLQAEPGEIWPHLRAFWVENGFVLEFEDPAIGIMETAWSETRPQERRSGFGGYFARLLTEDDEDYATRDRYRVRLERGEEAGTTELFVSHRGAIEKTADDRPVWEPRPSDPELEAEMLNRLMVKFGYGTERAQELIAGSRPRPPRAFIVKDDQGTSVLSLRDDFSRAWRRTGLALDRVGFTVQDRDRSRGLFFVRYVDPLAERERSDERGWLERLKFWGGNVADRELLEQSEFLISVVDADAATQVLVLDKEGNRESSGTGDRILSLLHEELK